MNENKVKIYSLLAKEVTDLNGLVTTGDGGIDGEVSIHETHLVAVTFGNTSDEILNMAKSSTDSSGSLTRTKPSVDLQLLLASFLVLDQLKIEVEMLEVSDKFAPWSLYFDLLCLHLDAHAVGDIHGF
ncbi:60s ribosomal protein l9-1 [Nicotiana attenuata]|uniref:60s ribosomal protein l9-1 n=1 Tax=Nicotiana attenuata TaxID=49451 RepID=A0A1J6KU72_NICAT|nr:60s ribosomal protein l9-1 [Nicotiana attenuata]OIT33041.1 60s ribosomal protein l9-1 [Nicotiana attenuata]